MARSTTNQPYRVGTHWGRTIVKTGGKPDKEGKHPKDSLIGVVDSPSLARDIVLLLNKYYSPPKGVPVKDAKEVRREAGELGRTNETLLALDRMSADTALALAAVDDPLKDQPTTRTQWITDINGQIAGIADSMMQKVSDSHDLQTGLDKLTEAQDWFTRAIIAETKDKP